ncbi:MAG TPA: molybdopterin oxidoreductase family protein [Chloroflexota bacterium]|nr:molybdopterin oxidoreductase family protein [Chloroflexota bacterium]
MAPDPRPLTPVKSVCPLNCPDSCGIVTEVQDGRVVRTSGDPDHPITRGWLCRKGNEYLERLNHPSRLTYPLRRLGPKGEGQFERINWDEALDTIAARWHEIVERWGPQAILPYGYSGTMGVVNRAAAERRFLNRLGASILDRGICSEAGHAAMKATLGGSFGSDPEDIPNARLILIWGYNPAATNPHCIPLLQEARRNGAQVVVVDSRVTETVRFADQHLAPYPGTDAALALSMIHVLFDEGLDDATFLEERTIGAEALRQRALRYPPSRVARITRLPPDAIRELALFYGTHKPGLLTTAPGLQRHTNGGQTMRALLCLAAVAGQYGVPGGGFLYNNRYVIWDPELLGHDSELRRGTPRTISINQVGEALLSADPSIKSLLVVNGNPAAVGQSQAKMVRGLLRDDLFTVVHEVFPTDTVDYADIVLPATMQLEQLDLHLSYWSLYLRLNLPAVAPPGECRSNLELYQALAERMGFTEPCLYASGEEIIRELLQTPNPYLGGVTWERLVEEPAVRLTTSTRPHVPFANGHFPTPSGKLELYSTTLAADGHDPLPDWVAELESPEATPALFARYPLKLLTPKEQHFIGSSFANLESFRQMAGGPDVQLNPRDASARGVSEGDWVEVFNERGSCRLLARVGDTVPPGVAVSEVVHWQKHSPNGRNVNWTTPDYLTDLGDNSTYHTNLVQVRRAPPLSS